MFTSCPLIRCNNRRCLISLNCCQNSCNINVTDWRIGKSIQSSFSQSKDWVWRKYWKEIVIKSFFCLIFWWQNSWDMPHINDDAKDVIHHLYSISSCDSQVDIIKRINYIKNQFFTWLILGVITPIEALPLKAISYSPNKHWVVVFQDSKLTMQQCMLSCCCSRWQQFLQDKSFKAKSFSGNTPFLQDKPFKVGSFEATLFSKEKPFKVLSVKATICSQDKSFESLSFNATQFQETANLHNKVCWS